MVLRAVTCQPQSLLFVQTVMVGLSHCSGQMRRRPIACNKVVARSGNDSDMMRQVITFASRDLAQFMVAGVPACVRACILAATRGFQTDDLTILAFPGDRPIEAHCRSELERLYPNGYAIVDSRDLTESDHCVPGEVLILSAVATGSDQSVPASTRGFVEEFYSATSEAELQDDLRRAGWGLVQATGKPDDGIVSRHINRHISMRISDALVQFRWIRPGHATMITAICAAAMFIALLSGTPQGLVAGAILFQIASIVDGIDGEIARVTQRTSARGATLDTITDGFTNVGFVVGLAVNLAMREEYLALEVGMLGATALALGCAILAIRSVRDGNPVTFDAVANWLKGQPGSVQHILIAVAKRDFFALASMVMVFLSLHLELLLILSVSCVIWLVFVSYVATQATTDDFTV
jgi:1L-myo-inositol 1-phosphate cytidylyltransferase / CDP-L-myo-inositol myo-inositolphosphotransferase